MTATPAHKRARSMRLPLSCPYCGARTYTIAQLQADPGLARYPAWLARMTDELARAGGAAWCLHEDRILPPGTPPMRGMP